MSEPKHKVNWTIDREVLQAVREYAQRLAQSTVVKISESAAANAALREFFNIKEENDERSITRRN